MLRSCKLKNILIAIILISVIVLPSCSLLKKSSKSMARWEDGVFISEWAGFKVPLPDGWQIATDSEIEQAMSLGAHDVASLTGMDADDLKDDDVIYPMLITEYPIGYQGMNTNIAMSFDKISAREKKHIKDANEFVDFLKDQLEAMGLGNVAKQGNKDIAGEKYATLSLSMGEVYQIYYIRLYDGYAINIVATGDINDCDKLGELVDSIEEY